METSTQAPPDTNDSRRTGATWVAATGAFLLLAAATVFVAARWDHIPDGAKLAALVGITGAVTLIGDRLRRTLPATGNALFHLGALLVPIDIAALGLRTAMTWQELLLVDAAFSAVLLAICARRAGSVVLAAASSGAVIAAAGGLGALTGVPAPFVLAALAVGASFDRRLERHAFVWAGIAGLAPITLIALDGAVTGHGVARELGLLTVAWPYALATAACASFVVVRGARRRAEPALALLAVATCVAQGVAVWHGTVVPHTLNVLAAPSLFLVVELVVLAARRDSFWSRPTHVVGQVAELLAAPATVLAVPVGLVVVADGSRSFDLAVAAVIGAVAWIVAEARRDAGWWPGLPAAAALALFSLATAFGSPAALVAGSLAIAFAAGISVGRERGIAVAYAAAGYGALAALVDPRIALAGALGSAAAFSLAVVRSQGPRQERTTGVFLAFVALGLGELVGAATVGVLAATLAWIVGSWMLALVAERVDSNVSDLARVLALCVLPFLIALPVAQAVAVGAFLTAIFVAETVRLNRTDLGFLSIVPALATEVALLSLADLDLGAGGLVMCVGACVWFGAAALARAPWRNVLAAGAAASVLIGLQGAMTSATTLGPALMVTGALAIAYAVLIEHVTIGHVGGVVATLGLWITLGTEHVVVSEAYLAPVALQLLVAGALVRTATERRPSSWVAYGPAIALLAGSALAERIGGGASWHSVLAGAVGVAAVAYGGWKRAIAPLLLGTAALIAVVVRESLDSAAGVPTWAWLAAGGSALIGAAIAMERADVSPVEAGRRVVDVIGAQFD